MLTNPNNNWYTDSMDVYRTEAGASGNLMTNSRKQIMSEEPCRIYRSKKPAERMNNTVGTVEATDMLACAVDADIIAGDEIIIIRGGKIGKTYSKERYFAGQPSLYYEPFGGVVPSLAHAEVPIYFENRVTGATTADGT